MHDGAGADNFNEEEAAMERKVLVFEEGRSR